MSKVTKRKPGVSNPELAAAMLGKRISNAAGTHGDKRTKRLRTRDAARKTAIRDFN